MSRGRPHGDPAPDLIQGPRRICACGKRAFLTDGEARTARRRWQRGGRLRSFNTQHVYRCDVDRRYLHLGGRYE